MARDWIPAVNDVALQSLTSSLEQAACHTAVGASLVDFAAINPPGHERQWQLW